MSVQPAKRILIAPLDWGLGHTTRCVPVIRHLLSLNYEVVFAGEQWQLAYITRLFPSLTLSDLAGYRVRYSASGFMYALMRQIPRIVRSIRQEHDWLLTLVQNEHIDGIISDNRYGLWHPTISTAILTHQVQVLSGLGSWADNILRRFHARYLTRFNQCWIVDTPGVPNLAGVLSHPAIIPGNARYIGWLSQLTPAATAPAAKHLLVLLSGPEPLRTFLSDLLWEQVCHIDQPVVFIEGSTKASRSAIPSHIQYFGQLDSTALQPFLEAASLVVCRSGYSSLMDLVLLGKKAVLIPTPGQTEQEYLAQTLVKGGIFYTASQQGFSLPNALLSASSFPFNTLQVPNGHEAFKPVLNKWLAQL